MKTWNIEDLEFELKKLQTEQKIYQWKLEHQQTLRKEFYLIQSDDSGVELDQDRRVEINSTYATVYTKKENNFCGHARMQLFTNKDLAQQIRDLVDLAELASQQYWELPEVAAAAGRGAERAYLPLKADLETGANTIYEQMREAILSEKSGEFNSSEIFVEINESENRLSNGLIDTSLSSKIYSEVCFSHRDSSTGLSEEFLLTKSGAHPEQLNFKQLCSNSAEFAKASLQTQKPQSGATSVIVPAEVLATLFHDLISHLEAGAKYYGMPFLETGAEVIPDFSGTPFKIAFDPEVDYAYASLKRDGTGLPLKKLNLIEDNKVQTTISGYQMAQYLNIEPTSSFGNIRVEAEGASFDELTKSSDQVLEILQFSGLFTNAQNLTFSSEIRLARLFDQRSGQVTFIKGGNLSGNIKENFKRIRFSNEQILENVNSTYRGGNFGYIGPQFALLTEVSISS
ncbi:MAG: hypothetical protein KDD61_14665 [Bdellovibrionales bacterium]|nr:hypothetical protein [Bdellovibrionales bacterium]